MTTRAELKTMIAELERDFMDSPTRSSVESRLSANMDGVIRQISAGARPVSGAALLAIGGYGRGTLHAHSDIDLLFFFKNDVDEEFVKSTLHPLWDLGLKVGHQVRSAADFAEFHKELLHSYTAFFTSRFLSGDVLAAESFELEILPRFIRSHKDSLLSSLVEAKTQRYTRFGHTVFQLEPDLKDAPGGLRDVHWSEWVRKVIAPGPEPLPVSDGFHLLLRNFLHFRTKRNYNVLEYEFQEQAASHLGYRDSDHGEAAETLMRDYFLGASDISRHATFWEEEITGRPGSISVSFDFSDPFMMVQAFAEAHRRKVRLDFGALNSIRARLGENPDVLRYDSRAVQAVLEMMRDRQGIYATLLAMHDVGLLGRIFPDFEEIRCRVIRDFSHRYTVDEHSLIAIRNIEELPESHRFSLILHELEHSELLLLSLLFHDIGKAHRHDDGNHVQPGTAGVTAILQKLGFPEEQAEKVIFAVKSHLEMSKIILRRDFSDEQVVEQFADLVGNADNLRMLCLLTYADMKAVNNEVLTPWKEDLLWQLYVETYNKLTLGLADDRYSQQPSLESEIDAIRALLPDEIPPQDVRDFLDGFPRRYLKNTPKPQIVEHFLLSRKLTARPMVMHLRKSGASYELLVMTADRPFLFSKITGVLSYFGMNILRGQAFSNRHETIFDLIAFEDPDGCFEKNTTEVDRFARVLNEVVEGDRQLEDLLRGKFKSVVFQQKKNLIPTVIHFDDEFSSRCTIMEITTQDAFGLLYRVARIISSHGCNIEVALITTDGPRATDVFYLTQSGKKLGDDFQSRLKEELYAALSV